jgi:hypothetical protein
MEIRTVSYICTKYFVIKTLYMKKQLNLPLAGLLAFTVLLASLTFATQNASAKSVTNDTIPAKAKDFDVILKDLDKSMIELEKQLQSKTLVPAIDMEKMKAELDKSLKDIDLDKMKADMEKMKIEMKAIPTIDLEKMKTELEQMKVELKTMSPADLDKMKIELSQLKEIDLSSMQKQMELSMKAFDTAKMHMDMKALASIDMEKLKAELEEVKNIDLSKLQMELKDLKPALENAKAEIAKAKEEITEYKNFTDQLDKDGLIKKDEKYTIEHKGEELIINGKVQSKEIYNKYRTFLEKHKKFEIKKDDGLNIYLD